MSKSKLDFKHLTVEAIFIVFAVLLALGLGEWRSAIKQRTITKTVLQNIVSEIESNKADLESKVDYHQRMSDKIGQYVNSDSLWSTLKYNSGIEAMVQIMESGLQNPNLQSGAWRSAELSGVVNNFDYETIYALSNVYRVQSEGPESTWKLMASHFGNPYSYEPSNAQKLGRMLQLGFRELSSQEKSLIISYEKALETLSSKVD